LLSLGNLAVHRELVRDAGERNLLAPASRTVGIAGIALAVLMADRRVARALALRLRK
jgi:hypothetical protein